ncbi:MAG: SBBP repeat-containing protein [Candidatus Sulfotelmatobacter sp.]
MSKPDVSKRRVVVCVACAVAVIAATLLVLTPAVHRTTNASTPSAAGSKPQFQPQAQTLTPAANQRLQATFAALPLAFEQNQGQADPQVKYMARGNGYKLFLTSSQAVFKLHKQGGDSEVRSMMMDRRIGPAGIKKMLRQKALQRSKELVATVRMNMLGANPAGQVAAESPQPGKVNYFIGRDPSKWHPDVPLFGQVSYRNLYPGVDLVFHGSGGQLEFDYRVNPGANAKTIALGFQGADRVATNSAGDLILTTAAGPIAMQHPTAYQEKDGARHHVDVRFRVSADNVTFDLGPYDHGRELVIDPTVTFSTYFGGDFAVYGSAITKDTNGNIFIAGATDSDSIPGDSNGTNNFSFDAFVTKVSSSGALAFTTVFGGSVDDFAGGIAVDAAGIYVAGTTDSPDFPATVGQTIFEGGVSDGNNDAFAVTLTTTGTFSWGTYIAGTDSDSGLAVAVDSSSHELYVVGETFSSDLGGATGGVNPLPHGNALNLGQVTSPVADDGYIVKLNSGGTAYLLVSYLGGSNGDLADGVALDPAGNIYVSGETISTDLPVTSGVVQSECGTDGTCNTTNNNAQDDAYIFAIQANLAAYKYVTYYGGSKVDDALAIAADSNGDAFITGLTTSTDFKTFGTPFQASLAGTQNAFAVELNPTGTAATYGTYVGGNGIDIGLGIALDSFGDIYLTGQTSSSQTAPAFPLQNPTQGTFGGSTDAFVTVLSTSPNVALFSTYLGGSGDEDQAGGAIALDSSNNIYVTGDTTSGNSLNGATTAFPTTTGALDGTYGGGTCVNSSNINIPCPNGFITAYSTTAVPDFNIAATTPTAVSPGTSATSTVTLTSLFGYSNSVTLGCAVTGTGSPLPACSASSFSPGSVTPTTSGNMSTLTITTTGASAAMSRPSKFFYAMWLPIAGMALAGVGFSSAPTRRKKLLGFLVIGMIISALFLMPACGGGSSSGGGGGGGCTTCTPAGNYTVTVTGTGMDSSTTTHSTTFTLTVN